jgi:hypothetical protein
MSAERPRRVPFAGAAARTGSVGPRGGCHFCRHQYRRCGRFSELNGVVRELIDMV